jgi:hypothetical protein
VHGFDVIARVQTQDVAATGSTLELRDALDGLRIKVGFAVAQT